MLPIASRRAAVLSGANFAPFADAFDTDGALGGRWTAPTWAIVGGKAVNTPTLGAELLSNVEFTTNTTGWGATDGATLTRRDYTSSPDIDPTGGADEFGLEVASGGNGSSSGSQAPGTYVIGRWYRMSARAFSPSANTATNAAGIRGGGPFSTGNLRTSAEGAWQTLVAAGRAAATSIASNLACVSATAGDLAHFDAPSSKQITLAEMFAVKTGQHASTVNVSAKLTRAMRAAGGVFLCLDDATTPLNFIVGYLNAGAGTAVLEKCVAGAYTSLVSAAVTYVAGAVLEIRKAGTAVELWYNGVQVGTTQTVTDAGVISNTKCGLFSTDPTNGLDDFSVSALKA